MTSLLRAGTPPFLVAEIMGHSIETLLRTYAHARPDAQREKRLAINKLSARLAAAAGRQTWAFQAQERTSQKRRTVSYDWSIERKL